MILTDKQKQDIEKEAEKLFIQIDGTMEPIVNWLTTHLLAYMQKEEEIARLRKELEKIKQEAEAAIAGKLINTEQKSNMALYNIKWSATEALKQ